MIFMKKDDKPGGEAANKKRPINPKLMKALDFIIPVAAVVVIGTASFNLYKIYSGYHQAGSEYDELSENAQVITSGTDENGDQVQIPELDVDFEALEAINSDLAGWFYMPVLDISYPVAQTDNNDYYLHHTFDKTENSSGSLFLDYESAADMTDRNTFLFGHNMKNGSMFGSLKKLRKDESLCDTNPYFFFYTKDKTYCYRIFAYYITTANSDTYYNFYSNEQYDDYIDRVMKLNEYKFGSEVDLSGRGNIMTLSTCSGRHTNYRLVVHGIMVDKIE